MSGMRGSEVDANLWSLWTVKYRLRSNIYTAVWVVIPKCKPTLSIIGVAFSNSWEMSLNIRSKLGLTQMLMDWQMDGKPIPVSHHAES